MEELIPVNSEKELEELFKQNYFEVDEDFYFGVKNLEINFPLTLPINEERIIPESASEKWEARYSPNNSKQHFSFSNCQFKYLLELVESESNLQFNSCKFNFVDAENNYLNGKIRFRECYFYDNVNFRNTTFYDLADFWRSVFYQPTIFFKTEFLGTTVFSATAFKENVLFTYSLIDKLILFRGTKIEKGFDLSTAIRSGEMGIFDFHVKDYKCLNKNLSEETYERAISETAEIPIKNKRETFRILKQEHISQNNVVQSIEYKKLEKETLRNELRIKLVEENKSHVLKKAKYLEVKLDQFNLWLNKCSNNHGSSYGRAFAFIVLVGWPFFFGSVMATSKYDFYPNFSLAAFLDGLKYFIQFLLPTHKFDYLGDGVEYGTCFYVFDFIGRLLVGYGIYQFIQAFRKFR
ncbi:MULTISPECIES: hypothetical protein [Maribacter]|uniref:Pentapeptide repeat-containing protein n=1 Tax=Maribacter flavus TaxID=1658664 RepID=A0ABU7ILA5_9FLAO|nr:MULTISPECIES: hypothetical protein [Maribacter]MDC6406323.1 hypothetical protein [Maribacter sp. PR66]MEE1973443.1 hypothetical protein [Maribacter flavus]